MPVSKLFTSRVAATILVAVCANLTCANISNIACAQSFQRVMTFDPNKGLVPGNNSESTLNLQSGPLQRSQQSQPIQTIYPVQAQNPLVASEKHPKHSHKFLFFGHREDDDTQTNNLTRSEMPTPSAESEASQFRNDSPSSTMSSHQNIPFLPQIMQNNTQRGVRNNAPTVLTQPGLTGFTSPATSPSAAAFSDMIPIVVPPNPPPRPAVPQVDSKARLPIVQNAGAKAALAWRAKAWRLSQENEGVASATKHPYRILQCSQKDAIAALINCCQVKGGEVYGQNTTAGQLAVRFNDSNSGTTLVIFVFKNVGPNQTVVKACLDSDRSQKTAILNELLSQTAVFIDGKGLL